MATKKAVKKPSKVTKPASKTAKTTVAKLPKVAVSSTVPQAPVPVTLVPPVPKVPVVQQSWVIAVIGGVVVLLLAISAGVYFYMKKTPAAPPVAPPTSAGSTDSILHPPKAETAAAMKIFANENDLITFIELVDVNLMANTRQVVWFYSDNADLMTAYGASPRGQSNSTPWMAGNQETINRQISVVNGNYSCVDIVKTTIPEYMPSVLTYAKHLCVVAVPPEYGKFSGYLSVWVTRVPNEDETGKIVERLRSLSARIGAEQ